ncbi:RlmE family RNA methyltransferase [Pseudahrensia aquimaris]|uniref:Ribosomal RNA large subunit methyltransferase E n=1 Tax=Pseudahrensia aquimaris TaxID=744461 RepID=A0ABW3FGV5_9HYPH
MARRSRPGGGPKTPKSTNIRNMHTKVKTARGRKLSSTLWLQRQLNDPYVQKAKAEGYASRAAYKLLEMDERYNLLKPGQRVLDLGAAPGGWCQVAAAKLGSKAEDIRVVGIDYLDMDPVPGATILKKDFLDDDAPDALMEALGGHAPDLVISDMAAPTTGHRRTDHIRTMALVEVALEFALQVLKPGGHFLTKTFQGGTEKELLDQMKRNFKHIHHVKPPASRDGSVELYLLAMDRKPIDNG